MQLVCSLVSFLSPSVTVLFVLLPVHVPTLYFVNEKNSTGKLIQEERLVKSLYKDLPDAKLTVTRVLAKTRLAL